MAMKVHQASMSSEGRLEDDDRRGVHFFLMFDETRSGITDSDWLADVVVVVLDVVVVTFVLIV